MSSIKDFRERGEHHEAVVCIPISSDSLVCLWHRKKAEAYGTCLVCLFLRSPLLAMDRAWKDHLWKIFSCFLFFFFLFSHHYSKLNKKGRAMRKGSYWDPPASPHKLGILRLLWVGWNVCISRCLPDTTSHLSRGDSCSRLVDGEWCEGGKVLEE